MTDTAASAWADYPGTDEWTEQDSTTASVEGWNLFEFNSSPDCTRLCRDDEAAIFAGDEQAWTFVATQAAAGSALHAKAISLLERYNPIELERWGDIIAAAKAT